jgi:hypothetical protein
MGSVAHFDWDQLEGRMKMKEEMWAVRNALHQRSKLLNPCVNENREMPTADRLRQFSILVGGRREG